MEELLILRLKGELPGDRRFDEIRSKTLEECVDGLRSLSGRDLGTNAEDWEKWWIEEKKELGE